MPVKLHERAGCSISTSSKGQHLLQLADCAQQLCFSYAQGSSTLHHGWWPGWNIKVVLRRIATSKARCGVFNNCQAAAKHPACTSLDFLFPVLDETRDSLGRRFPVNVLASNAKELLMIDTWSNPSNSNQDFFYSGRFSPYHITSTCYSYVLDMLVQLTLVHFRQHVQRC